MKLVEVIPTGCVLGESPVWDGRTNTLYWVDIHGRWLGRLDATTGAWAMLPSDGAIGSIALTHHAGTLLAAVGNAIRFVDVGGEQALDVGLLGTATSEPDGNRFNDGKTDRQGRFWVGTMDDAEVARTGATYRLDEDGLLEQAWGDVGVPNGWCFSADGRSVYTADSWDHTIWSAPYDPDDGRPGEWTVFAEIEPTGSPDGSTVDAEDHVWNAEWGASRVVRYAPDGAVERILDVPVSRPTCPAFGGADLDLLFVTSAAVDGRQQDADGSVLVYETGVAGLPETPFAGRHNDDLDTTTEET